MKKLLLLFALFPSLCFGQVTAGFHRVNQIIARGNSGVTAQVVPGASVFVAFTLNGSAAVIYSDPLLTLTIPGSIVTTDNQGNYDYYLPLNTCVTETISYPSSGTLTVANICGNAGLALPIATLNGGTGTIVAPTAGQLLVGQTGSVYAPETLSGDCTLVASGAITCLKTNGVLFTAAAITSLGTSGATIPLLSNANTFGQDQTIQSSHSETGLNLINTGSTSWSLQVSGTGSLFSIIDNTDGVTPLSISDTVITATVPMNIQGSPVCTSTNGVCASGSGTVTDFSTGSWPSWLTPSVANPTSAPILSVTASAIPNSSLANSSFTINTTTTCTLGSNCNLPGSSRTCNANGCYEIGADGTIEEWGRAGPISTGANQTNQSVTFPFPFTTTSNLTPGLTAYGCPQSSCSGNNSISVNVLDNSIATTGFTAHAASNVLIGGGGANLANTIYILWTARGN